MRVTRFTRSLVASLVLAIFVSMPVAAQMDDKQAMVDLVVQIQQLPLDGHGFLRFTSHRRHAEFMHQFGRDIGSHADIALSTAQHQGHSRSIVA